VAIQVVANPLSSDCLLSFTTRFICDNEVVLYTHFKLSLVACVDAIIIDTVDVIIGDTATITVITCSWDLSMHVNSLQPNHHFTGSSGLYILARR
jgi:hypothetical protein